MPAWSFRSRFRAALANGLSLRAGEPPVYLGILPKLQTIRAERADGRDPEVGVAMNVWLDMRSPGRVFLGTTPPIKSRVQVAIPHRGHVQVGDRVLTRAGVTKLARADGFQGAAELYAFVQRDHGWPFVGFRFRW